MNNTRGAPRSRSKSPDIREGVVEAGALFLLLFSLAMLAWSGTLQSSDGLAMYAVSHSLAREGRLDIESVRWLNLQQGTFGPDGLLYSRKGLTTSLLALPLTWLGLHLPALGPLHAALLLTPLLHAATGLYLYMTVRRAFPAASAISALQVTLLWAVGSMALPYSGSFFSEPAVALAMTGALYHLLVYRDSGSVRAATVCGAWLGLSFLTRSANAITFPLFTLALILYARRLPETRARYSPHQALARMPPTLMAFVFPLLLSGLLYLWYNWVRFGDPLSSGYLAEESFSGNWLEGILGLTVSPGRGLLWYTPWLPLALPGAWRWRRREQVLPSLIAGSTLLYILLYGKWYLWSGGVAWGPRFLVPILPLLAFLVAPLLSRPATSAWPWRGIVWIACALGFLVNAIGVLWSADLHQQALDQSGLSPFAAETFFRLRHAQIPGLLSLGVESRGALNLAWYVEGSIDYPALLTTLALVVTGSISGLRAWRGRAGAPLLLAGSLAVVGLSGLLLARLYAIEGPALRSALQHVPSRVEPGAQLWYDDARLAEPLLNQVKEPLKIIGFNVGEDMREGDRARAETLAANAMASVYLLSDGPERSLNPLDGILNSYLFRVGENEAGAYRVVEYWQGPMSEPVPYETRLSFPDEGSVTLVEARITPTVSPGSILALEMIWRAESPLSPDLQLFLHLYDASGEPVLQQDRPPTQGHYPPELWRPGARIVDRHALRLPRSLPPGDYAIHFGLYRLGDGARASSPDGTSELVIPLTVP